MRWNPFLNAIAAASYIGCIALTFQFISHYRANTPDTFLDPIAALSLLVFSVATMAFLFFYRPLTLLLDEKREEAVSFFLKTLGSFGIFTLCMVLGLSLV